MPEIHSPFCGHEDLFIQPPCYIQLFFKKLSGCTGSLLLHTGFLYWQQQGLLSLSRDGSGASHCRASLVVEHRLKGAGSVAVAHALNCPRACGIFPDQGSNPCPHCVGMQILSHWATREVLRPTILTSKSSCPPLPLAHTNSLLHLCIFNAHLPVRL